jgi:hypothetical protein
VFFGLDHNGVFYKKNNEKCVTEKYFFQFFEKCPKNFRLPNGFQKSAKKRQKIIIASIKR